jgi:hypothetical protein
MPENYFESIAQRVAEIAKKSAQATNQVRTAIVISSNPDGSFNVDDGMGGCTRVANLGDQLVQCGQTVILGLEPQIGTTTNLCQVQFTINASSKDCPVEDRTDDNETEPPVVAPLVTGFLDNRGRRYDLTTGIFIEFGAETADVDPAFGYSFDLGTNDNLVGASPSYDALIIGNAGSSTGYQGETYSANNTVLCLGVGAASGVLCGAEISNVGGGAVVWTISLRDAGDYSLITTDPATYIQDWMSDHASEYFGDNVAYDVNITADPDGSSFWVGIGGNNNANQGSTWEAPMFQVGATDLSLISTVLLQIPPHDIGLDSDFFRRANRFTA